MEIYYTEFFVNVYRLQYIAVLLASSSCAIDTSYWVNTLHSSGHVPILPAVRWTTPQKCDLNIGGDNIIYIDNIGGDSPNSL